MSSEPSYNQWHALDIVKSLCVGAILFTHAHFLLITRGYRIYAPESLVVKLTESMMIIGVLNTIVPITAGCVMRMKLINYTNENGDMIDTKTFIQKTLFVSIFIATMGFLMNALTWNWGYLFSWNMLQMIAVSYSLIAIIFVRFKMMGLYVMCVFFIGFAQPLAHLLGPISDNYFIGILIGNDSRWIFWPLFPWCALPVVGFIITHFFLQSNNHKYFQLLLLFTGCLLVSLAIYHENLVPTLHYDYVWTQLSQQPPIWEILGASGFFMVLLQLSNILAKHIKLSRYGLVNSYSKGILWIYLMQMIVSYQLAPIITRWLPVTQSLDLNTFDEVLVYAALPLVMLLSGWLLGALMIRYVHDKKYRITLRKA